MFRTLLKDRSFIEGKYHKKGEPYESLKRFDYVGWEPKNSTGLTDEAMLTGLRALFEEQTALPHPVAKANAVRYITENSVIDLDEHDYFLYFHAWRRMLRTVHFDEWSKASKDSRPEVTAKMKELGKVGAVKLTVDYDHVIPNWDDLLSLGFPGLLARAEQYREMHEKAGTLTEETAAFFDGILIEYRAALALLDRYIAYGKNHTNSKTETVVPCLEHLREGAPTTFYEALQCMYLFFLLCECVDHYQTRSFGNGFDQSLYRFYRADLKSGRYTEDELKEFLGYFFLQFAAIDNYWGHPLYLGGTDANGESLYNELSLVCLDVQRELDIHNPKIQLKLNANTPDWLLRPAMKMVRDNHSSLVFNCEPGMVKALATYGVPYEEAYNYEISGCYESRVKYGESSTVCGYINGLKAVLYVFSDGFDEKTGTQVGVHTGSLSELKTFTDFYTAFLRQWRSLVETTIGLANEFEQDLAWVNPSNIYSGTVVTALQKGVDAYSEGVKYPNSAILNCGFASTVDSLLAVKEFVYDKKRTTLEELAEALNKNWEGYEPLRREIRRSRLKYGNGEPEADRLACGLSRWFTSTADNRPNCRGGVYKTLLHSALQFVEQGKKTGASPDGRFAGEEESKNASPSIGMDREGVTALILSATALDPTTYSEAFCLDLMMHPSSVAGEDGLDAMKTLLMTYLKRGGQSIQFNIFDAETLKDAQKHPEKYENLQIRVCGWNVLWNNLPKEQQDAYIARAENAAG